MKSLYFIFDFQKFDLRLTKVITKFYNLSFIQYKYNDNSMLHTTSVDIIKSHPAHYLSGIAIACVTRLIRGLVTFQYAL